MTDFRARAEEELGKVAEILRAHDIETTAFIRVDPDNGHSFANFHGNCTCLLHYRAKSMEELSRQLEAVRTTLELLEGQK